VPQPTAQLLIYPATDLTRSMPSHRKFGSGFFLETEKVEWYMNHYLTSRDEEKDPMASPLFEDDFAGLAPAIVVTAGFDVLRDEGQAYADELGNAGVHVDYTCEAGLIHGFFNMSGVIDAAQTASLRMARKLSALLG